MAYNIAVAALVLTLTLTLFAIGLSTWVMLRHYRKEHVQKYGQSSPPIISNKFDNGSFDETVGADQPLPNSHIARTSRDLSEVMLTAGYQPSSSFYLEK